MGIMEEEWQTTAPKKTGHYLVYWDNVPSQNYPDICSKYDIIYWSGRWFCPISTKQPLLAWREIPKCPESLISEVE